MSTPIQTIETSHRDMIHDAQLDYYSKRLATCSSDRSIKVYDVTETQHTLSAELAGHDGPVWHVTWAHPRFGTLLASCGYDQRIIVHTEVRPNYNQPAQWNPFYRYDEHKSSVNSISWAPNEYGLILAAASSDGTVSWHEHVDGTQWNHNKFNAGPMGCNAVSWAPFKAPGTEEGEGENKSYTLRLVTGTCDGVARIWSKDAKKGEENFTLEHSFKVHEDWVRDVAWAPTSSVPTNTIATCSEDKTVWIHKDKQDGNGWQSIRIATFQKPVWRVSWSITGNVLAVSTGDQEVSLWKESIDGEWVQFSDLTEQSETKQ
jgi:protein transport protein SEC13